MAEKSKTLPDKNARVKEVIDHFADGNVARFSAKLDGVSQQLLNRLFHVNPNSKNKTYPEVSQKIVDAITRALPVNAEWLISGNGEMVLNGKTGNVLTIIPKKTFKVPLLQDVITYSEAHDAAPTKQQFIDLGGSFPTATGAMRITGNAMYPAYENGCIIAFRQFKNPANYIPGEVYIVKTDEYEIIRRVQSGSDPGKITLVCDNPELNINGKTRHEDKEIDISTIISLSRVLGKISKNEN